MYTAFFALLLYACFGGCPHLAVGPDAMLSLLFGSFARQICEEVVDDGEIMCANPEQVSVR